ncbi:MAG: hypothetical protein PHR56_04375 [Dehalococcoidales bacterium]|nr:hypothetical protein [Dehalococcoidales bacterium]
MNNKSLNLMMTIFFGIPGLTVLVLSWFMPHLAQERAVALFAAAVGIAIAVFHGLKLRTPVRKHIAVEAESQNR